MSFHKEHSYSESFESGSIPDSTAKRAPLKMVLADLPVTDVVPFWSLKSIRMFSKGFFSMLESSSPDAMAKIIVICGERT